MLYVTGINETVIRLGNKSLYLVKKNVGTNLISSDEFSVFTKIFVCFTS